MSEGVKSLLEKATEKIDGAATVISDSVIDVIAKKKIEERVSIILKSIACKDKLSKVVTKMKPDIVQVDVESEEKTASWSKDAYENFTKAKGLVDKVTTLINKALEDNTGDTYGKLSDFVNKHS